MALRQAVTLGPAGGGREAAFESGLDMIVEGRTHAWQHDLAAADGAARSAETGRSLLNQEMWTFDALACATSAGPRPAASLEFGARTFTFEGPHSAAALGVA